jgi:hypothetical protein
MVFPKLVSRICGCFIRVAFVLLVPTALSQITTRMTISDGGVGQALLFPMYTVENGSDTYFSITNQTERRKATRVRFIESLGGETVFSVNLFIRARSTVNLVATPNSASQGLDVVLGDNESACAIPEFRRALVTSVTQNLTQIGTNEISVNSAPSRVYQGFVEVLEMGELPDGLFPEVLPALRYSDRFGSIRLKMECSSLAAIYDPRELNGLAQNQLNVLSKPSGGLSGSAVIISVAGGLSVEASPTVLDNVFSTPQHSLPIFGAKDRDRPPSLSAANNQIGFPSNFGYVAARFESGIDAVSALLQTSSVAFDVIKDPAIGAGTVAQFSFPTKHFYAPGVQGAAARAPFTALRAGTTLHAEAVAMESVSRSGMPSWGGSFLYFLGTGPASPGVSGHSARMAWGSAFPPLPGASQGRLADFFGSVVPANIYGFPETNGSVLFAFTAGIARGSGDSVDISDGATNQRVLTASAGSIDGVACRSLRHFGLPVIGVAYQTFVNGNVSGFLSNYGVNVPLRITRKVECVR